VNGAAVGSWSWFNIFYNCKKLSHASVSKYNVLFCFVLEERKKTLQRTDGFFLIVHLFTLVNISIESAPYVLFRSRVFLSQAAVIKKH
jgi:hypothetical protein